MVKSFEPGEIVQYRESGEPKQVLVINKDDKKAKNKQVTYDYNMNPVMLQEYTDYDGNPEDAVFNCVYLSRLSSDLKTSEGKYDLEKIKNKVEKNQLKLYAFHSERLER